METTQLEDSYRLSPLQEGMLFHRTLGQDSGVEIFHIVAALGEALDPVAFRRAWQRIVDRYAIFRTGFPLRGGEEPVQEVHREASLEWREE
ncbi:MAG TPA: condensation domain-containing protein, partial [Thermoanaerobaculia bacterium]|nr:condensation domain-containing protein [Thermoanaerobaculia bacterium]